MIRKLLTVVVVLGVIAAGARLVVERRRAIEHLAPPVATPMPVRVAQVREGELAGSLRTAALVQAETSTTLSAQAAGVLLEVRVREGDRVTRGQVLARVDARTLDDVVVAAQARLAAAVEERTRLEAIHKRDETLLAGQAMSQQAFEAGRAQLESARAAEISTRRAAESAATARGYAEVRAPRDGVVTARLCESGDLAAPGKPLFTLQSTGSVRMLSRLSQDALGTLSPGARATFQLGSLQVEGLVTRVFPALDASRLVSVETLLPQAPFGLPPGAVVGATYYSAPATGLIVPSLALLQGRNETVVIRVRDGRAAPLAVTVKQRGPREALISGALQPGEDVVVGLPSELMALTAGLPLKPLVSVATGVESRP